MKKSDVADDTMALVSALYFGSSRFLKDSDLLYAGVSYLMKASSILLTILVLAV